MNLSILLLASLADPGSTPPANGLLAIRVGRAETATKGTIEHAVILIEDGKIGTIGEDLAVERGIPILDKPGWVAIPGLVDAYSRLGLDGEGGEDNSPEQRVFDELYPGADEYPEVLKYGVTTLGLYPAGNGIPGQAVVIRPTGKTPEEMRIHDPAYLKIILRATSGSKKLIREGFKKADEYNEKAKKAREKWDKDQEAKKKKTPPKKDEKAEEKKSDEKKGDEKKEEPKKDEEKKDEKKEEGKSESKDEKATAKEDAFVPPPPDPKVKPFLDLRAGKLRALVSVSSAAEYVHLIDALGKEKIGFDLRVPLSRDSDIFYVESKKTYDLDVDGIGDLKLRVVLEPVLTLQPGTMRQMNLPMELSRAGAKVVFIPRNDNLPDFKDWLSDVGEIVSAGLDRNVALRAMTSEPAALLGVDARLGSLEKGKDANLVFLSGDPFEPSSRIQAVMLEGKFVYGEVKP